jgi:hypothetical protein
MANVNVRKCKETARGRELISSFTDAILGEEQQIELTDSLDRTVACRNSGRKELINASNLAYGNKV